MKRSMLKRGKPLNRKRIMAGVGRARKDRYRLLRGQVWRRDGGQCVLCGLPVPRDDFECHHRQLRSRGGRDFHSNLITLHHECHRDVHAFPQWALENGFMVPTWASPAEWPVHNQFGRWVVPDDDLDGAWSACEPHPDQQASQHPRRPR